MGNNWRNLILALTAAIITRVVYDRNTSAIIFVVIFIGFRIIDEINKQ